MTLAQWIIRLNGIFFLFYGLGFLFIPEVMINWVTGSVPVSDSALMDTRATYGGMSLASGLLFYFLSIKPMYESLGLVFVMLMMGNMAFGRTLGILLDGNPNFVMWLFLAGEIITLVLSGLLFLKHSSKRIKP